MYTMVIYIAFHSNPFSSVLVLSLPITISISAGGGGGGGGGGVMGAPLELAALPGFSPGTSCIDMGQLPSEIVVKRSCTVNLWHCFTPSRLG